MNRKNIVDVDKNKNEIFSIRFPEWVLFSCLVLLLASCSTNSPLAQLDNVNITPLANENILVPKRTINEMRVLTVDYPQNISVGASDIVELVFDLEKKGDSLSDRVINGPETQSIFETHHVMAEARLDMAGVDVRPGETISQTLLPGQRVIFYWSILPLTSGRFGGNVWFYLRFIPKDGSEESRIAISVQQIEIKASSYLGLQVITIRWISIAGIFLGTFLAMPTLKSFFRCTWKHQRPFLARE